VHSTNRNRIAKAGKIRIIGGEYRGRRIAVPERHDLRPTPDRVRETLFNWLGQDLAGWRCIDAFAGTGALGLEAASRGASDVLLVEQDPELVTQLRAVQKRLSAQAVRVERGNGLTALQRAAGTGVDLVFLDPPFDANLFDKALAAAVPALSQQGLVYLEAPDAWNDARLAPLNLALRKHLKAGAVHAHLLERAS
jgi:16S rRNA (guanine966-N2)-methyltransferase